MSYEEMVDEITDCAESGLTIRHFDSRPEFPKDLVRSIYERVAAEHATSDAAHKAVADAFWNNLTKLRAQRSNHD